MQIIVKGRNIEITQSLQDYATKRAGRLSRYMPEADEVRIELARENTRSSEQRHIAQITIQSSKTILRAEEHTNDMYAAIDNVIEKINRRIARYRGKQIDRWQKGQKQEPPVMDEELEAYLEDEDYDEEGPRIVRVKRFMVNPMNEEEAVEQMELLGHNFFVFYNADLGRINVVYRRRDGNYGVIDPEIA